MNFSNHTPEDSEISRVRPEASVEGGGTAVAEKGDRKLKELLAGVSSIFESIAGRNVADAARERGLNDVALDSISKALEGKPKLAERLGRQMDAYDALRADVESRRAALANYPDRLVRAEQKSDLVKGARERYQGISEIATKGFVKTLFTGLRQRFNIGKAFEQRRSARAIAKSAETKSGPLYDKHFPEAKVIGRLKNIEDADRRLEEIEAEMTDRRKEVLRSLPEIAQVVERVTEEARGTLRGFMDKGSVNSLEAAQEVFEEQEQTQGDVLKNLPIKSFSKAKETKTELSGAPMIQREINFLTAAAVNSEFDKTIKAIDPSQAEDAMVKDFAKMLDPYFKGGKRVGSKNTAETKKFLEKILILTAKDEDIPLAKRKALRSYFRSLKPEATA